MSKYEGQNSEFGYVFKGLNVFPEFLPAPRLLPGGRRCFLPVPAEKSNTFNVFGLILAIL
jgi:hypothetical protein